MEDKKKFTKPVLCAWLFIAALALYPQKASAFGTDFLGDLAQPIVGPAKDKMKGLLVYVWLQPYVGYGFGSSDQTRIPSAGVTPTKIEGVSTDGFIWGGKGGILLFSTFKIGVDYSVQSLKRETLVEGTTVGTYLRQPASGKQTTMGATLGFDIPYTPVQGFVTKFFKAKLAGDAAEEGDGWGGGISFVIKSPFIVTLETRKLNYASDPSITGKAAEGSVNQYYATLSFMLF